MTNVEKFVERFNSICKRATDAGLKQPSEESKKCLLHSKAAIFAAIQTHNLAAMAGTDLPKEIVDTVNNHLNDLDTQVTLEITAL